MSCQGLVGERVRLVPSEAALHLDNALRWFNDPEVTRSLANFTGLTRREAEQFFERMATQRETDLHWAILTEAHGHVGFIALHQINWHRRMALGGIVIGERSAWGQGLATDAFQVRARFAFEELGLHRIEGHTINPATRRVYEKAGYVAEGCQRRKVWRGGAWHDVHLYALLDTDYFGSSSL